MSSHDNLAVMAVVTLQEAAKLTGKSERTLLRHRDKGKLSMEKNDEGHNIVDTAELIRAFGPLKSAVTGVNGDRVARQGDMSGADAPRVTPPPANLEARFAELREDRDRERERAERAERRLDDMQTAHSEERNRWHELMEKQLAALADHRPPQGAANVPAPVEQPQEPPRPDRRAWWRRFWGVIFAALIVGSVVARFSPLSLSIY